MAKDALFFLALVVGAIAFLIASADAAALSAVAHIFAPIVSTRY